MNLKRIILVAVLVLVVGGVLYWRMTASPPPPPVNTDDTKPTTEVAGVESSDNKARRQLLGVWQDHYEGKRTMTLNDDGTGTMLVELSGMKATLYAAKLRFDMKWSLKGDKLTKTSVGGEPTTKVNLILNMMGNTTVDTLLEVNENRLLLLDKDGKTKYDWQRVKSEETVTK